MGAGLLAAAGDIGGSIVSGMFSTANAKRAQGFSEHMANTAHRREVKDLRLAGLNPILSAGGSGAPSPAGVPSSMPDPKPGTAWSNASSAKSQRDLNESAVRLQTQQALTESEKQASERASQALMAEQASRIRQLVPFDMNLSSAQAAAARNSSQQDEFLRKLQHKLGNALDYYFPDLRPGESPTKWLPGMGPISGWAQPGPDGAPFGGKAPPGAKAPPRAAVPYWPSGKKRSGASGSW